jgi:hypothetical protein
MKDTVALAFASAKLLGSPAEAELAAAVLQRQRRVNRAEVLGAYHVFIGHVLLEGSAYCPHSALASQWDVHPSPQYIGPP